MKLRELSHENPPFCAPFTANPKLLLPEPVASNSRPKPLFDPVVRIAAKCPSNEGIAPWTFSKLSGLDVPMPMLPFASLYIGESPRVPFVPSVHWVNFPV